MVKIPSTFHIYLLKLSSYLEKILLAGEALAGAYMAYIA